jgi:hypothetical protein
MTVHFDTYSEPVWSSGHVQCDMDDDCHMPASAKVCGSDCRCRVNVCTEHGAYMDDRWKCPFTGRL